MRSRLHPGRFLLCGLAFALPAFAQLDSSALRVKYGTPLNREVFHIPSGFDLTVDYGAGYQVCKLQVPALMPTSAVVSNTDEMTQRMYAFLSELIPVTMRGRELRRWMSSMGAISLASVDYEKIAISELQ